MNWPSDIYPLNDIFLDAQNIRLPSSHSAQDAVLHDLFSNEDAFDLVKSIAQNDFFPDELPILIEENGKYTVIEGNRRIAALKALNDPDRVPAYKDKIRALKNPNITAIRALVAPNRDAAVKLLANKHTINLRKPWKPLRQAYFYKSQIDNGKTIKELKQEYPDHDISKFIKMLEVHHIAKSIEFDDPQVASIVHDERKFPITNLERMYDDPYVSEFFGMSFDDNGKINIEFQKDDFSNAFRKIVEDVATGVIDSRKFNTRVQRKEYIDEFPVELIPQKKLKKSFSSKNFKDIKLEKQEPEKTQRSNKKIKGLIPPFIPFKLPSSPLKKIYDELRRIDVDLFPNATHDLLRSFFECTLIAAIKGAGEFDKVPNSKKGPSLSDFLTHLQSDNSKILNDMNLIKTVRQIKSEKEKPYSVERMNMINHNETWISKPNEVREAWTRLEPLMKKLLNPTN